MLFGDFIFFSQSLTFLYLVKMLNIRSLLLDNFRIFSDVSTIKLAPVTILTGPNGCGKSSVAGSLSLMKSLDTRNLPFRIRLDSAQNPYGSFEMMTNSKSVSSRISIGYDIYNIILGEDVRILFSLKKEGDFDAVIKKISIKSSSGILFDFKINENTLNTKIGVRHFFRKLNDIKRSRAKYAELERKFKEIRSASGSFKDNPAEKNIQDESRIRIFHIDNDLKRKKITDYLKEHEVPVSEYERLFYLFGIQAGLPGDADSGNEKVREIKRILSDYEENDVLFNNKLLKRIVEIPAGELNASAVENVIKNEFPDLYDCLVLLKNPEVIGYLVSLIKTKDYREWEKEFLEDTATSSRQFNGNDAITELSAAIENHFQYIFRRSAFLEAVTELSTTREGFLQVYNKNQNLRTLSSFIRFVLETVFSNLEEDLEKTLTLLPNRTVGLSIDLSNPLHGMIKTYMRNSDNNAVLKEWFAKFGLCDDVIMEKPSKGMSYFPGIMKNEETMPLSGESRGTGNLLTMLLGIACARENDGLHGYNNDIRRYPRTIIVEEPETGLHPAWQSKLANVFADAKKEFGLHFLIETHSDYLIKKLQYLVAIGELDKEDVIIYYFDNAGQECNGSEDSLKEISINEDGSLSREFGSGFFDDEDALKIHMLNLKRTGRN